MNKCSNFEYKATNSLYTSAILQQQRSWKRSNSQRTIYTNVVIAIDEYKLFDKDLPYDAHLFSLKYSNTPLTL